MTKIIADKNIWYMNHYSGSIKEGNYGRPFFLSKTLNDMGIHCRVIAASYHHQMRSPVEIEEPFYSDFIESVPYTWVKTPRYVGNGFSRLKNMIIFAWKLWKHDLVKEFYFEKPDVIIVSSVHPFHYFAGRKWARKYKAKLIFEVRDIWPLTLTSLLGVSSIHPLVLILGWIEKLAYKNSDQVVSLLPNAYLHMKTKGLVEKKYNHIPNGIYFGTDQIALPSSHEEYLIQLKEQNKFIIAYTGNHGVPNAMMQFLEAAKILKEQCNNRIALVLLGKGIEKEKLMSYAHTNDLNNVHFLDPIRRSQIPEFLEYTNVCLVGGKNISLYKFGVSYNKVFEYMFAAKPIIFTLNSPNNPVEKGCCGICIKSDSPQVLADAMERISRTNEKQLWEMGARGRKYVEEHHSYKILAQKFIEVIEK